MKIGRRLFVDGTKIMGILNVTPDSFFSGSRVTEETCIERAIRMVDEGADVLDLGAQSTRPGHTPVSAKEEISRLRSVLPALRRAVDVPISVDTYYADVARYALDEGADLINDIWGLTYDGEMAKVISSYHASVCIMHNQNGTEYRNFWRDIEEFLDRSVRLALDSGIDPDRIVLDGGVGFGKTKEQNWELLNGYHTLSRLGYPLLLGVSRKSMFGGLPEERLLPTLQATKLAVRQGILFVRVHDVKENLAAIKEAYDELY